MIDVYYTYLFFKSEELYDVMVEFYIQNKWWFDHLPDDARIQCSNEHERVKGLIGSSKAVNEQAVQFFEDNFR